jgi:putative N6-adenine-specific DNA methylase
MAFAPGKRSDFMQHFFATCARGLEPVLSGELRALGALDVEPGRGGASFAGDRLTMYRANLYLRTAIRVLCRIFEVPVESPDDLYKAVQTVDWRDYMTPEHTLAVDCNVRDSALTHSHYAALRVKDAICDQFVAGCGRRPSVDVETPMVGLNLHVYKNQAVLSLDSSGESLHKRGYRPIQTRAPLNEALASGILLLGGYDGTQALVDPLCGGGTLLIEGAWIALNRPPGLTRKRFGFQGWLDFDVEQWAALRDEARAAVEKQLPVAVAGSDERNDAIAFARDNAKAAGVGHAITFQRAALGDFRPPADVRGMIVCNPPYGERIGEEKELRGLYRQLGETLRMHCAGWTALVFTGNPRLAREIGMAPQSSWPLFNGKIPCQLLKYHL